MGKRQVQIFEVGPRDGLQNESTPLSLSDKIWFAEALAKAGIEHLELGAFVRPDRVPQMADTDRLYQSISSGKLSLGKARAWALVPNRQGLARAIAVSANNIALFTAVTDSFTKKNMGMTVQESLIEFKQVIQEARNAFGRKLKVRGYISTAFACPFEGKVAPAKALKVIEKVADLGVDQISIGDTIGVATPGDVKRLMRPVLQLLGSKTAAGHFHDTTGMALANSLQALELGVTILDSSAGGLGGCPFAPGASGNLSTEDLIYMLNGLGVNTGVNLPALCDISLKLAQKLKRPITSRYLQYYNSQRK